MKNHFLIPYAGNKRNECEDLYNEFKDKLEKISTIIEPFCGTSSFSYYISLKHPKKFKYVLNDNNKFLIELYETAKDEKKLEKLINLLNSKIKELDKEKYNMIVKEKTFLSWIIINKIYLINPGRCPNFDGVRKNITSFDYLKDCPIINFLKTEDITFYYIDGIEIVDKYKNDECNFIFLDPPYLISCNDFYADAKINVYEYLYENQINNMKALIILCLESNWIIKLLFNNQVKKEYSKKYEISKKHTTHLIISNFS